jgi:hypothetical protein
MHRRRPKSKSELEIYVERFNAMGLELPEAAAANPTNMRCVALFLLKNKVFDPEDARLQGIGEEPSPS